MGESAPYVVASDTIIISDLLYFVTNKLHTTPFKTVVTVCHTFYTDDDYVFNEKKKLCDATNEHCSARRNDEKRLSNIEDICTIILRRDSQNLFVPKFASLKMNNVPMSDDGNPSLGQVLAAISDIKRNMVTTEMLASSIQNLNISATTSSVAAPAADPASSSSSLISREPPLPLEGVVTDSNLLSSALATNMPHSRLTPSAPPIGASPSNLHFNKVVSSSNQKGDHTEKSNGWSDVNGGRGRGGRGGRGGGRGSGRGGRGGAAARDSSRQRGSRDASQSKTIIGKRVSEGLMSVKGADLTVNKYIGRVHNDTTMEDLREYIVSRNVTVVELEPLKTKHARFQSFRFRAKREDLEQLEDRDFWPKGILFSSFFRPKSNEELPEAVGGSTASTSLVNGS